MSRVPPLRAGSRATLKNAKHFEEEVEVLEASEIGTCGKWCAPGEKLDIRQRSGITKYRVKVNRTGQVLTVPESHLIETQETSQSER